jgi:high-affinity K+ transport system ATPase subunit B
MTPMKPGKNAVVILVSSTFLLIAAFVLLAVESKGAVVESRIGFVFLGIIALLVFLTVFFAWISPKDTPSDGKARKVNQPPIDIS